MRRKHILREGTPAGIAHKLRLLLGRGVAALVLDALEDADGVDVGADLFLRSALADLVGIRDAIIGAGALGDGLFGLSGAAYTASSSACGTRSSASSATG